MARGLRIAVSDARLSVRGSASGAWLPARGFRCTASESGAWLPVHGFRPRRGTFCARFLFPAHGFRRTASGERLSVLRRDFRLARGCRRAEASDQRPQVPTRRSPAHRGHPLAAHGFKFRLAVGRCRPGEGIGIDNSLNLSLRHCPIGTVPRDGGTPA